MKKHTPTLARITIAAGAFGFAGAPFVNAAPNETVDYEWNTALNNQSWSNASLWTPDVTGGPSGAGLFVRINPTAGITINLFNTGDSGAATKTVGRLDIGSTNGQSMTLAAGTGSGVLNFNGNGGNAQLNLFSSSNNLTLSAPVSLSTTLDVSNNSTVSGAIINFSGAVTGTGGVNVNTGVVRFSGAGSSYSGVLALNSGGTLDVQNSSGFGTGGLVINGGTLKNGSGGGVSTSNAVTINGDFTFNTTTAANRDVTLNGATNLGTAAGTSRTITVATGGSSVGTLVLGGVVANGSTANTIIKEGAGVLRFNNKANTFSKLVVNAGVANYNGSVLVSTDTPFGTSSVELGEGATLSISGGNNSNLGTAIVLKGNGILTPTVTGGFGTTFSGVISETGGSRKLTVGFGAISGNVSAILGNTNTYTGGTDFNGGASTAGIANLTAGAVNALGGGASGTGGVVTFTTPTGGAVSRITLGANQSIAGLTNLNAGTFTVEGNNTGAFRTLTINNTNGGAGDGSTFAGALGTGTIGSTNGNALNFVKEGTGTQVLTGTSSHSGTTAVNGGSLLINGSSSGTGSVTVGASGTLGGNGSIAGATTVAGILSPGSAISTVGNLTFTNGLTFTGGGVAWEIASNSLTADTITLTGGTLTLGSGVATVSLVALDGVDFADTFWATNQTWTLVDNTGSGTISGSFDLGASPLASVPYGSFSLTYGVGAGADVFLNWTAAIPEPSTYATIVGLSLLGYAALRRRRRTA